MTEPSRQQPKKDKKATPQQLSQTALMQDDDIINEPLSQVEQYSSQQSQSGIEKGAKRKSKLKVKETQQQPAQASFQSSQHEQFEQLQLPTQQMQSQQIKSMQKSMTTNMDPPRMLPMSRRDQAKLLSDKVNKQPRQKLSRSDSRQRRLEKNRQSARESRKRKKGYIEDLELQLEAARAENVKLRTANQNLREKRKIAFLQNIREIDDFLSGRQELYQKLERQMEDPSSQEIKTIIECLRERSGTYGVQRKQLINNLFKGIVDLSFPHFVKYLFWGSSNNLGLFGKERSNSDEDDNEDDDQMGQNQEDLSEMRQNNIKLGNQPSQTEMNANSRDQEREQEMIFSQSYESSCVNDESHSHKHQNNSAGGNESSGVAAAALARRRSKAKITNISSMQKLSQEQIDEFIRITDCIDMSNEQKQAFRYQQKSINESKQRFKSLIDQLVQSKTAFMHELQLLEQTTDKLKEILTPEQTALYLIQVEKFKHKSTTSIFNLWGLRKQNLKYGNDGTESERADSYNQSSQQSRPNNQGHHRMMEDHSQIIDCCEGQSNSNHQDIEDVSAFPDDSYESDDNNEDNNEQSCSEESSERDRSDDEMSSEQKISSIFKQRQKKDNAIKVGIGADSQKLNRFRSMLDIDVKSNNSSNSKQHEMITGMQQLSAFQNQNQKYTNQENLKTTSIRQQQTSKSNQFY